MRTPREKEASPELKFSILQKLLSGKNVKQVAYEEDVHQSTVYLVRKCFPLFFTKKED
jgi:transposase-like protein